jgi:hypothetical protein
LRDTVAPVSSGRVNAGALSPAVRAMRFSYVKRLP